MEIARESLAVVNVADDAVITIMVREGISINDIEYPPMTVVKAIELFGELCEDCKDLIRALVKEGLQNDVTWKTVNECYKEATGHYADMTVCKHCIGVRKRTNWNVLSVVHGQPLESITLTTSIADKEEDTCGYRGDGANDLDNIPVNMVHHETKDFEEWVPSH